MKPLLHLYVGQAGHFLRWERPLFAQHFTLVEEPSPEAILLAFGPDVLRAGAELPARRRVAYVFPGFGFNPYHNLELRREMLNLIEDAYDLVMVNPGPVHEAYKSSPKAVSCPFSIDTRLVEWKADRRTLDSLIHVSNPSPQKDWQRSERILQLAGLRHEVFPPRDRPYMPRKVRRKQSWNRRLERWHLPFRFRLTLLEQCGYVDHRVVVQKYQEYAGFVHVAAERPDPLHIDGKYTACLLEAGLTGAILFWHDTLGLGNDLETVFDLPLDPAAAAARILEIRDSLDVQAHSRRTRAEILGRFHPERSVGFRCEKIKEIL